MSASDLSSELEAFRTMISRLVEQLNEVSNSSKTIPGTSVEQLSRKLTGLAENLQAADKNLTQTTAKLEEIRSRWGRR